MSVVFLMNIYIYMGMTGLCIDRPVCCELAEIKIFLIMRERYLYLYSIYGAVADSEYV